MTATNEENTTTIPRLAFNIMLVGASGVGKSFFANCINNQTDSDGNIIKVVASGDSQSGLTDQVTCALSKMFDNFICNLWDSGGVPDSMGDASGRRRTPEFTDRLMRKMKEISPDLVVVFFPYPHRIGHVDEESTYRGFLDIFGAVLASYPSNRIKIVLTKAQRPNELNADHEKNILSKFQEKFGTGVEIWHSFFGADENTARRKLMIDRLEQSVSELVDMERVDCSNMRLYSEIKKELKDACKDRKKYMEKIQQDIAQINAAIADNEAHMNRLQVGNAATCWIPLANLATIPAFHVEMDKARQVQYNYRNTLRSFELTRVCAQSAYKEAEKRLNRLTDIFNDASCNI